jgi:pyruvate carboxylase
MPGKVIDIVAQVGAELRKGQVIFITEAMKMEYTITAKMDGTLKEILVKKGDMVASGELLGLWATKA